MLLLSSNLGRVNRYRTFLVRFDDIPGSFGVAMSTSASLSPSQTHLAYRCTQLKKVTEIIIW